MDGKDCNIIKNLYWDQTAKVRVEESLSDNVEIKRGIRQGCILLPTLFSRYTEDIFSDAKHVKIFQFNGRNANHLTYGMQTIRTSSRK